MTRYVRVRGALQCYWSRYQLVERTTEVTLDRVLAIDDADGNDEEMLLDQLEADGVLVDPNGDVPRDSDWMHDSSAFGNLAWATVSAEEYEQALGPKRVIRVDPDTGEFCGVLLESEKLSGLPAPVGPFSIPHR